MANLTRSDEAIPSIVRGNLAARAGGRRISQTIGANATKSRLSSRNTSAKAMTMPCWRVIRELLERHVLRVRARDARGEAVSVSSAGCRDQVMASCRRARCRSMRLSSTC